MSNIDELNRQVADVKGVMRDNVNKVMDRGDKLERLEGRAEELNYVGGEFQKTSRRYHRKQQCAHAKLWLILICIIIVIVVVIAAIALALGFGLRG